MAAILQPKALHTGVDANMRIGILRLGGRIHHVCNLFFLHSKSIVLDDDVNLIPLHIAVEEDNALFFKIPKTVLYAVFNKWLQEQL